MPLVKKRIFLAAGATSAGTSATADTTMDFTVNNAEFSRNASVSKLVDGQPFGAAEGSQYIMNNMVTTGAIRNRPIITFTNTTAATRTVDVAVFIGN